MKLLSPSSRRGFTLVELMTAITILVFLALMLVQIISLAIQSTNATLREADAIGQSRFALDRFGNDWDNRLRRGDVPFTVTKYGSPGSAANDTISFYSSVNGFTGSSVRPQLSQVDYVVDPGSASVAPFLKRGVLNASWSSTNPLPLGATSLTLISSQGAPASTDDYQSLADDISRFEVCFLLKSTGHIVAAQPANFQDVGAIIVSVASLNHATRVKLSTTQINTLVSLLADAADGTTTTPVDAMPADMWNTYLQSTAAAAALPPMVIQSLRIDQRYYYVR